MKWLDRMHINRFRGPLEVPKPRYIAEVHVDNQREFSDWYAARDWEAKERLRSLIETVFSGYPIEERERLFLQVNNLLQRAGTTVAQIVELSQRGPNE